MSVVRQVDTEGGVMAPREIFAAWQHKEVRKSLTYNYK